jgi:NADH:ubiquinone oxidoreductase subunit E
MAVSTDSKVGAALVVGGGIGGMQAALDLAESGIKVYLLDNSPAIGGVMAQLDKTFPTNDCAMCTMAPRLVQIGRHKDVEIITLAELDKIRGEPGNFTVTINRKPRFVKEDKCTGCGTCAANCPVRNEIQPGGGEPEVQLEPDVLAKIKPIVDGFRGQRGVLVPLLQDIQAAFNWLPENVLRYASRELHIPLSLMVRTATFYKAFSLKPVGRHKITVCLGTTCHVKGAPKIIDTLERELHIQTGGTTADGNFTLEAVYCLGCCGLAPVLTVGEDLHGKLNQSKLPEILGQYQQPKVEVKVPVVAR